MTSAYDTGIAEDGFTCTICGWKPCLNTAFCWTCRHVDRRLAELRARVSAWAKAAK